MKATPWLLKSSSADFAKAAEFTAVSSSVESLSSHAEDWAIASNYTSSHSGALTITVNNTTTILDSWDGAAPSSINIDVSPSEELWYPTITTDGDISWGLNSTKTEPSTANLKGPQGSSISKIAGPASTAPGTNTEISAYVGTNETFVGSFIVPAGSEGVAAGFGNAMTATITALASNATPTVSVTPDPASPNTAKNFTFSFGVPSGVSGKNGENGATPVASLDDYAADEQHPYGGTKVTFTYPDGKGTTVTAVIDNGRPGDAGSLPILPPNAGEYILSGDGEEGKWIPYTKSEGGAVSGENGLSARKDADGTTYLGMDVETIDITGAGSVTVTSNPAGQLVISGKDATIPENIVTSSTDQASTGPWVLSAGQWVNGTSLMSMYKTSQVSQAKPVDSIVYNFHNSLADAQNNYNYIQITAGSNRYSMYTLVQPFKSSVTASNGISAEFTNDGVWQFGLDYTDITAADTQYAMTTTGWAEITGGGTGDYLPLTGGTVSGEVGILGENLIISAGNVSVKRATDDTHTAFSDVADYFAYAGGAFMKRHDDGDVNGNMVAFGVIPSINLADAGNLQQEKSLLDLTTTNPICVVQRGDRTQNGWTGWNFRCIFANLIHDSNTTVSDDWEGDNTLHFILE